MKKATLLFISMLCAGLLAACGGSSGGHDDSDIDGDVAENSESGQEGDSEAASVDGDKESDLADGDSERNVEGDSESAEASEAVSEDGDGESASEQDSESQSEAASDSDSESDSEEPASCANISLPSEFHFEPILRGQRRTQHVTACNTCNAALGVAVIPKAKLLGACDAMSIENVVAAGVPVDISSSLGMAPLLLISLRKDECAAFDIVFDSTKMSGRPAFIDCLGGGMLTDGSAHYHHVTGEAHESLTLDEAACLAMTGTCAIGGKCYADGALNADDSCQVCAPATSRTEWSLAAEGASCNDGNPATRSDVCGATGICQGVAMNMPPEIIAISGSYKTNCVLSENGAVSCWGRNSNGQVGQNPTTAALFQPTAIAGLSHAMAISVNNDSACAALLDGGVRCWGSDANGELGDGTSDQSDTPVAVANLTERVAALGGGSNETCAVLSTGAVKCWGLGENGQLGNGQKVSSHVPVDVDGISDATDVGCGEHFCCALHGTHVSCWGSNSHGQLGDGTKEDSAVPLEVSQAEGATQLAVGLVHVCALLGDGNVVCWGFRGEYEWGTGTTADDLTFGTPVGLSGVTRVFAYGQHSCALLGDGSIRCWGCNRNGELSDGTENDPHRVPVELLGLFGNVRFIAGGSFHSCMVMMDSSVKCVGSGGSGQLGAGSSMTSSYLPVDVIW